MNIIVLGSNREAATIIELLVADQHNCTVISEHESELAELQEYLDIVTVVGSPAHPDALRAATAEEAEILLALTMSDEVNILACQVAYTLFHTPLKFARVRTPNYLNDQQLFLKGNIPVDIIISPENELGQYIRRLITFQGSQSVLDFAGGRAQLVAMSAFEGGANVHHQLADIKKHLPKVKARITAIYRQGKYFKPTDDLVLHPNDQVLFIAGRGEIPKMMKELRTVEREARNIMIAGGGVIGSYLARTLEQQYNVKLIERSSARTRQLSEMLTKTLVLQGDTTSEQLMQNENIAQCDYFCALTNDDEANILSSMLARKLGARKVITIVNRPSYVDMIENKYVDVAIAPQLITIGILLRYLRRGDVLSAQPLLRGSAEAMEIVAHGDELTSRLVGKRVADCRLPPEAHICAVLREEEILLDDDTVICAGDRIIVFIGDISTIHEVEKLFQVDFGFF